MFKEPDEPIKKAVLEDLETSVWAYLAGIGGPRTRDFGESDAGWLIIALSPDFASKLEKAAGDDAKVLYQLISASASQFLACLLRSTELAYSEEPLRIDSLRELFAGLGEILDYITTAEVVYRQSLIADKGEQQLPPFLRPIASRLRTLLEDYVIAFVRDMEQPSDEIVDHLLSQCGSLEEQGELLAYFRMVDQKTEELLAAEDVGEELLLNELTAFVSSLFDPKQ